MADFTLACDTVVVLNPPVPRFKIRIPTPSLIQVERPEVSVLVQNPPRLKTQVRPPSNNAVVVLPVPGPAGPSGVGVQEVYVQPTEPAQGATPWFLAQLDAPGGTVEFLKVYEP